jgi:glycerate-2-kinase
VEAGLAAVDPAAGLTRMVQLHGDDLVVAGRHYDLAAVRRVIVLGAGKATLPIAEGLSALLGDRISAGLVVVQRGAGRPVPGIEVWEADHPVPSLDSLAAAESLLALAGSATADDLVITAFTGGSSALASLPPQGISFGAKQELHRILLASGLRIEQINAVRKHVSAFKGGRLAQAAAPAPVINLTLPDVTSGRLDCITDPTVPDESSLAEVVAVLRGRGLWDRIDPGIRAHLSRPDAESPDLSGLDLHTVLVTDGERACAAMSAAAVELGLAPYVFGTRIEGESSTLGALLGTLAVESVRYGRPFTPPCALIGAGGEAVVTLSGHPPRPLPAGGPNQETALAFARALPSDEPILVAGVFLDSDGSDGGTHAAGAVVDGRTPVRALELDVDLSLALLEHRSTATLAGLGELIVIGPTGTNISDLWAVVIQAGEVAA